MNPVMYPFDHDREGMVPPWKQGNDMANEIREWDVDGLDAVMRFLLVPIALLSILLLATAAASAKPKSPKFHFTLSEVQLGCINGNGTFTPGSGPVGYGCTGTGGNLSCTAKGNCIFTPKLRGLKIARNTTLENLIRGEAGAAG
jgi:hypothetical protein